MLAARKSTESVALSPMKSAVDEMSLLTALNALEENRAQQGKTEADLVRLKSTAALLEKRIKVDFAGEVQEALYLRDITRGFLKDSKVAFVTEKQMLEFLLTVRQQAKPEAVIAPEIAEKLAGRRGSKPDLTPEAAL